MKLRPPHPEELTAFSALCLRSKAHWGYDEAFLAACREELSLTNADLADTELIVAETLGEIVGIAQVSMEGQRSWLEKLFVEPTKFKQGAGRLLYQWAINVAQRAGAAVLIIEADPGAVPFYERMGARRSGTAPSGSIPGRVLPRMVHDLRA